ncbi:MAG: DUF6062 family protein [Lachnospiraceae bacterium]|nr:DUF6062 family protein [Lachnospiraceae bacterium]
MKEQIYTIPVNEAFDAKDECPLCFLRRKAEQDMLDLALGSSASYMEPNVREQTDALGFCREHFQKMYTYGNSLGNAWILKTYLKNIQTKMHKQIQSYKPGAKAKKPLFGAAASESSNPMKAWTDAFAKECFICKHQEEAYERYLDTVFYLWKSEPDFVKKFKESKGFCIPHFGDLCEKASQVLPPKEQEEFFQVLFPMMEENLDRIYEDVSWLIEKYDYRNKDADWKNSRDAVPRAMQKVKGGYPADAPYQMKK